MHLAWRWFTGLGFDQEIPHHSTFSKNRHGRFQESKLFEELFEHIVRQCVEVGLVQGQQLLAHNYFLDRGELEKAGEELARAAKVYSDSAADAPVEFTTFFVFGSAYTWRSAEVARQWWARVEAKKPRLNSDYWLTLSALHWVEGD